MPLIIALLTLINMRRGLVLQGLRFEVGGYVRTPQSAAWLCTRLMKISASIWKTSSKLVCLPRGGATVDRTRQAICGLTKICVNDCIRMSVRLSVCRHQPGLRLRAE